MWINIASLTCIIPDCKNQAKEEIKRMSDEHIQSVTHSSIKCENKFKLNSSKAEGFILPCHRSCVSSYTSQHHMDRCIRKCKQLEEMDNSVEKRAHQSICQTLISENIVYFVEKSAKILIQKIMTANSAPFMVFTLKICLLGNCKWSKEVKSKVESAASDAHNHQECKINFLHSRYFDRLATSEKDIDTALPCVIKFMKANEKEIWNSVEVHNIYLENRWSKLNRWNFTNFLKKHFEDSHVALLSPGAARNLNFRKSGHFHLQNSNDIDDKDVKEFVEPVKTETDRTKEQLTKFNLTWTLYVKDTVKH